MLVDAAAGGGGGGDGAGGGSGGGYTNKCVVTPSPRRFASTAVTTTCNTQAQSLFCASIDPS